MTIAEPVSALPEAAQPLSDLVEVKAKAQEAPPPQVKLPKDDHIRYKTTSTTSHFDDLPAEIVAIIAAAVAEHDTASLKALRSVNKSCEYASTRLLFHETTLLLNSGSIRNLNDIYSSPRIRHTVTNITINTAKYTDTCIDSYDWDDRDAKLKSDFEGALRKLGRLSNLKSVYFRFSDRCAGPRQRRHWWDKAVPESIAFRTDILVSLFGGLNDKDHPTPRLHKLTIENLQDWFDKEFLCCEDFKPVIQRIDDLSLQIASEVDDDAETCEITPASNIFFELMLPQFWHCMERLVTLKLYGRDLYWGYHPRTLLPTFSKLKSLTLGRMSFSSESKIDWLFSHAATLEELTLDDCPIIPAFHHRGTTDEAHNILVVDPAGETLTWTYDARWHNYFDRIPKGLPNLKTFRCGFGDWYDGNAFQTSQSLGPTLWPQRYRLFDVTGFTRPPFPGGAYDGTWENPPEYPDCTDEDLKALIRLRKCLNEREGKEDDAQFLQLQFAILDRD